MTPIVDAIRQSLPDKVKNLCPHIKGQWEASRWIRNNLLKHDCTPMPTEQFYDVLAWCEEKFGNDWVWNWESIYFKNEKDYLYFVLKYA